MSRIKVGAGIALLLLGLRSAGADEKPAVPPEPGAPEVVVTQPDEAKFPEIAVYFELRRPDGTFQLDADRADFRVSEDGRERPIVSFEAPMEVRKQPTTIVLVLDVSGSMNQDNRIGALKRAVDSFLGAMPPGSRVAVVAFASRVELICPFTSDPAAVREAVGALRAEGATRYYDAVAEGLKLLAEEQGRRAVLAMTDGRDTMSQAANLGSVVALANRLNLPVHTLALGEAADEATLALQALADRTRGQHRDAAGADQLRGIFEEIARRLGVSYSLTYTTDRKIPDGTLRPIRIAYAHAAKAGQAAVFIRGMVVPARGWSGLFLGLLLGLFALLAAPGIRRRWVRPA